MDYMFLPLKRYAEFSGRSRRREYWLFSLLILIVSVVVSIQMFASMPYADPTPVGGVGALLFFLFFLAILVPSLAVQVRRFHDQDKSGWLVLLNFVPAVGGLIVLVFMCLEGTRGPNRYGPDPKAT